MRFFLGVAESSVFPATLVLLAHWFPRRGTGARQCALEPLPAAGGGGLRAVHRLVAGRLRLADDADAGRRPALPLAPDLVALHQRPSARGEMDFTGGTRIPGNDPGTGSRGTRTVETRSVLETPRAMGNPRDDRDEFSSQFPGLRLHDLFHGRFEITSSSVRCNMDFCSPRLMP